MEYIDAITTNGVHRWYCNECYYNEWSTYIDAITTNAITMNGVHRCYNTQNRSQSKFKNIYIK